MSQETKEVYEALNTIHKNIRVGRHAVAVAILKAANVPYTEPTDGVWLIRVGKLKIDYYPYKHRAKIDNRIYRLRPDKLILMIKEEL
jgi:hypothetical protein